MRLRLWLVGPMALLLMIAGGPAEAQAQTKPPQPLAVFPIELWDTSGEGAKPDQAEKLADATAILAKSLEQTGRYRVVDLTPYTDAIENEAPRYACNGCWRDIAKKAGATVAALSTIHKVSSLISSFSIAINDVDTGKTVAYASGQFRGDTVEILYAVDRLPRERGAVQGGGGGRLRAIGRSRRTKAYSTESPLGPSASAWRQRRSPQPPSRWPPPKVANKRRPKRLFCASSRLA